MAFRGSSPLHGERAASSEHVRLERYSTTAGGGELEGGRGGSMSHEHRYGGGGYHGLSERRGGGGGVSGIVGSLHDRIYERGVMGGGAGGRDFGFLSYVDAPRRSGERMVKPMVWDDSNILTEAHYHHGDHHHNHHQRHVHHYHDHHFLGTASETLDLRYTPEVETQVIAGDSAPQMKLRPDLVGQWAFEAGSNAYWDSASRERLPSPPSRTSALGSEHRRDLYSAGGAASALREERAGGYSSHSHSSSLSAGGLGAATSGLGLGAGAAGLGGDRREVREHYESYRSTSPSRLGRLP